MGLPKKLNSDKVNQIVYALGEVQHLDINHKCPYHPQYGGSVERAKGTLKNNNTKTNCQRNRPRLGKCITISTNVYAVSEKQNNQPITI